MTFYKNKNILVAGGTGLIGTPLVNILLENSARVRVASLDDSSKANPESDFLKLDLTNFDNCLEACSGMDYVFNLLCAKGSPKTTIERPASLLVPALQFNTNLMEAARLSGVDRYLFTSSIAVYSTADIFYEDDVWKTNVSEKDKFGGWEKRTGELQAEAYQIEFGWDKISIVRPSNVYGPHDNFDSPNAMVVPSLIKKASLRENPFNIWGDGSQIRDFIYSEDVADGMLFIMKNGINKPVNLGSGIGHSIKSLVEIILNHYGYIPKIIFDSSNPSGDKKRVLNTERAKEYGFSPKTSFDKGIKKTIEWYEKNKDSNKCRYDIFN
jgi:GDP-L-fucose synthase